MPGIGSVQCWKPDPKPKKAPKPLRRASGRPVKPTTKARRTAALARVYAERDAKDEVRERDQSCRWPDCNCCYVNHDGYISVGGDVRWLVQEVAHLEHKGMGGDKKLRRTQPRKMILLCRWRHQGPRGIDSKLAKVVPLNAQRGTDGPCEFFTREKGGRWISAGIN